MRSKLIKKGEGIRVKIQRSDIVILGGGIVGLSVACDLSEKGRTLTIVEKNPFVGGLARSVTRKGFIFDLGGHRFYSDRKSLIEKLKEQSND